MVGILGAADLANNIASATKGLAVAFGLANPEPQFPEFPEQGITAEFQKEHWYKNPSQGLYSFDVQDVGEGNISEFPDFVNNITSLFTGFFDKSGKFGEFKLPITPQEITQTEDFAVSLKPTQGGTVVNHSGNKYKTLTIAGTTGVSPYKGSNGVLQGTGNVLGQPDELKYRSGYEVFQHFRQWMRAYHEMKSKNGTESKRMLFKNYKDWEFLYVEPIKFTMRRDATKPLLYNYMIQFRVIGALVVKKPLFDLAVSKLNQIGDAINNSTVLIKNNKNASQTITGDISDFQDALRNVASSVKAANREALTMLDMSKKEIQKLSTKEVLFILGSVGGALISASANPAVAENKGTAPNTADPKVLGFKLNSTAKSSNPPTLSSLKSQLSDILDGEAALTSGIKIDVLPASVQKDMLQEQIDSALISRVRMKEIQSQGQALYDKLVQGVGLSDSTYNSIFAITSTTSNSSQAEVNDSQFEMMYALSKSINNIDGILSSDDLFDTNANLYKKADASNGADSVGKGIFSLPNPNSSVKEGFLPSGMTLEDLALQELGDSSRWTEIAELNNLKPPYIVSAEETLGPNYKVEAENFYNPNQIKNLNIGDYYLIPDVPTPTGAWAGKGNYITTYLGGDITDSNNWTFIFPDEGTLITSNNTQNFLKFQENEWVVVDVSLFSTDGVLKPGDKIKIPNTATKVLATPLQGPRDNPFTNILSNAEKSLSVDLKLTNDLDLDLTPSGDLNVATGYSNGAQAIVLKLLYEKGSLKKFPSIGTNLTPGKKMPDIAAVRSDITTSLLQDTRIKSVSKINIIQENSALFLTFEVVFMDLQQPIPVTLPI